MNVPDGVKKSTNMVCKLKRALYGLKQAPRCWYRRFDDFLRNLGFRQCQADKCVYFANYEERKVIIAFYVDDGLIFAKDNETLLKVINELKHVFEGDSR